MVWKRIRILRAGHRAKVETERFPVGKNIFNDESRRYTHTACSSVVDLPIGCDDAMIVGFRTVEAALVLQHNAVAAKVACVQDLGRVCWRYGDIAEIVRTDCCRAKIPRRDSCIYRLRRPVGVMVPLPSEFELRSIDRHVDRRNRTYFDLTLEIDTLPNDKKCADQALSLPTLTA